MLLRNRSIDLTPSEFNILLAMASQPGRAFSRMELLDAAQGEAYEGYERSIDVHIKNLRQKLGDEPRDPTYILTVYGVGYKFNDNGDRDGEKSDKMIALQDHLVTRSPSQNWQDTP